MMADVGGEATGEHGRCQAIAGDVGVRERTMSGLTEAESLPAIVCRGPSGGPR